MPTYDYRCSACGYEFEEIQKISSEPLNICPKCQKHSLGRKPTAGVGISLGTQAQPNSSGGCCPCGKNKNSCSS